MLQIENLHVWVGEREILRGVDLVIREGETHVLLGPNGGGKSTLLNTIVGLPGYRISEGRILFKGVDLAELEIDERARLGIGIAFQRPPAVRGVKLRQLIEVASHGKITDADVAELDQDLNLGHMLGRDVNMGFSGGEAKRSEMAQILAQSPDLALFDEPESGVDLDNIAVVGGAINRLLKSGRVAEKKRSGLIITHTGHILQFVNPDVGHILFDGRLACHGNPFDLIEEIEQNGYEKCAGCAACMQTS
ncbi:MAG: ABC transporter ATP-binding protein [Coriobacteriia bacterium]|nr:ABC transporter ATP-binding protein [Coriobacteriia bacterium]